MFYLKKNNYEVVGTYLVLTRCSQNSSIRVERNHSTTVPKRKIVKPDRDFFTSTGKITIASAYLNDTVVSVGNHRVSRWW